MVKRVLTLYFDAKAKVTLDSSVGQEFNLQRGVRQGCPASPSFFTVALSFIGWSFRLTYEGIKLVTLHLSTLEYADDQILFTLTAGGMQSMLDFIIKQCWTFRSAFYHRKKCELICFSLSWYHQQKTIYQGYQSGDRVLPWKQSVVYLGSRIAEDGNTLVAVKHRICCAETVIKRLDKRVFSRRNIDAKLKGHFIDSAVFRIASLWTRALRVWSARPTVFGWFLGSRETCTTSAIRLSPILCGSRTIAWCHATFCPPATWTSPMDWAHVAQWGHCIVWSVNLHTGWRNPRSRQTTPSVLRHNQGRSRGKKMSSLITADRNNFGQS